VTGRYLADYIGHDGEGCDLNAFLAQVRAMPAGDAPAAMPA